MKNFFFTSILVNLKILASSISNIKLPPVFSNFDPFVITFLYISIPLTPPSKAFVGSNFLTSSFKSLNFNFFIYGGFETIKSYLLEENLSISE